MSGITAVCVIFPVQRGVAVLVGWSLFVKRPNPHLGVSAWDRVIAKGLDKPTYLYIYHNVTVGILFYPQEREACTTRRNHWRPNRRGCLSDQKEDEADAKTCIDPARPALLLIDPTEGEAYIGMDG